MVKTTGVIRLAGPDDAAAVQEIYAPFVTDSVVSFELTPPSEEEMARRLATTLERTPWLVYEADSRVLGYAYAGWHRQRPAYQWTVEVSAYLREEARRRGIARLLYQKLFDVLVLQGFYNAVAGITLPNEASVSFHTAMGFKPVGVYHGIGYKFGAWHDTAWFERDLRPRDANAEDPVPLSYIPCAEVNALLAKTP
jgi:L-amino acid N-acyltransferase YncA